MYGSREIFPRFCFTCGMDLWYTVGIEKRNGGSI